VQGYRVKGDCLARSRGKGERSREVRLAKATWQDWLGRLDNDSRSAGIHGLQYNLRTRIDGVQDAQPEIDGTSSLTGRFLNTPKGTQERCNSTQSYLDHSRNRPFPFWPDYAQLDRLSRQKATSFRRAKSASQPCHAEPRIFLLLSSSSLGHPPCVLIGRLLLSSSLAEHLDSHKSCFPLLPTQSLLANL